MEIEWETKKLEWWEYPEGYTRDEDLYLTRGLAKEEPHKPKYVAFYHIDEKLEEAKKEAEKEIYKAWRSDEGTGEFDPVNRSDH